MNPYSHFTIPAFDRFLVWLSASDLRLFFLQWEASDGVVRFVHVLAAGTLFGAILLMDLKLLGRVTQIGVNDMAALTIPWAIAGGVLAILTGLVLLLFDPIAVGVHTFFLPKMALIVLGIANAAAFHRFVRLEGSGQRRRIASGAGALSIALWAGVFLCAALNGSERITSAVAAQVSPVANGKSPSSESP